LGWAALRPGLVLVLSVGLLVPTLAAAMSCSSLSYFWSSSCSFPWVSSGARPRAHSKSGSNQVATKEASRWQKSTRGSWSGYPCASLKAWQEALGQAHAPPSLSTSHPFHPFPQTPPLHMEPMARAPSSLSVLKMARTKYCFLCEGALGLGWLPAASSPGIGGTAAAAGAAAATALPAGCAEADLKARARASSSSKSAEMSLLCPTS
jgi:hypothetical protein